MLVQSELKRMCTSNLPLQVNYAVGRLVTVIVYCVQCGATYYSIVDLV